MPYTDNRLYMAMLGMLWSMVISPMMVRHKYVYQYLITKVMQIILSKYYQCKIYFCKMIDLVTHIATIVSTASSMRLLLGTLTMMKKLPVSFWQPSHLNLIVHSVRRLLPAAMLALASYST